MANTKKNEPVVAASGKKSESGCFWVDKDLTCNGCKYLNFYKKGCRRGLPPGQVKPLSTYTNGDEYVAVLRPTDCDYDKNKKESKETAELSEKENEHV